MASSTRKKWSHFFLLVCLTFGTLAYVPASATPQAKVDESVLVDVGIETPGVPENTSAAEDPKPSTPHTIFLKSRQFEPGEPDRQTLQQLRRAEGGRVHILLQLDFIPRQTAREALAADGIELLAYVPDYAWIASVDASDPSRVLDAAGVTWAGELMVADKLHPSIQADRWGSWSLAPDGTAAVFVALHKDESLATGRTLIEAHGGKVTGEVIGINLLTVEMPKEQVATLAAEEAVQWIEQAMPPLGPANDGIRLQIGVDTLQAAPYELDGTGIDVLVYDSGQVGAHVDYNSRLTIGASDGDSVSPHSTHVAGIIGGDGSNSASEGGSPLQWRGMAPNVDLISYGTEYPAGTDPIFYQRVPDIENDFAEAQNSYGADQANASVGSNVYQNYNSPAECATLMGAYGSASVLIDQIVRGGNSTVGNGDRYITAWAAGNERNQFGSCSDTYESIAPPAAAKNPIHVGASNTNNNSMTTFSSWGPTRDGRVKPIVVAGGCQTTGDGGITSTDNNPVDEYQVMCGTSMATPAVSGLIALMLEHYRDVYNTIGNFWPSTAKAILMQTADDHGNPFVDYVWGYGQVNGVEAIDLISRRAFRQESLDQGAVDLFTLIVPNEADPVIISLAWDDYEATFNADPALINDLDLELVSPDGTIWRPWILDPDNPASNANRGVDDLNNQEQVIVTSADESNFVGTWMVRVRGTTVPQGPQSYSLACEGCRPLNVGVCQSEIDGTRASGRAVQPSSGELWQRSLEATLNPAEEQAAAELAAGLAALETAINQGPEAVVALLDTLRGPALDIAMNEIVAASKQLAEMAPPRPESPPISLEEELAAAEAQRLVEEANRAQALTPIEYQIEQEPVILFSPPRQTTEPAADRTVGNSCAYSTIAAAIADANPGDRLLIEGGRTFYENLSIPISLTLQGGYDGCATGSSAPTTIDGSDSGRVFTISGNGLDVTLENLIVTNGTVTGFNVGGGIAFSSSPTDGTLHLSSVEVYTNTALIGGGIWIDTNDQLIGYDVDIYENLAGGGGGIALSGSQATISGVSAGTNSYIRDNRASEGGGVYGAMVGGYAPQLNLPAYADLEDNQALNSTGLGGGVYMREGSVSLADGSDLTSNDAIQGGGAYLVTSTLTIASADSEIGSNTATGDGGGLYAQGSIINLDDDAELFSNMASDNGGGAYLDDSDIFSDKAAISFNSAGDYGGGVYATNNSIVNMDLGIYTCADVRCSQLAHNTAGSLYGGGVYVRDSQVRLDNTFVENNTANLGGSTYAYNGDLYAYNSLFARNNATSGTGDAVRLFSGSSMTGAGNTIARNDASGASTGQAIGLSTSSLTLGCSIVWGHSESIDATGQDVSYSDVEGGYVGTGNLDLNPQFVSVASQDYHLQSSSPVIDRCSSLPGMTSDFENEPRPVVRNTAATPYDMGADEVDGVDRVGINGACSYGTIQQAVNAASDGDTIRVAAGIYFENLDLDDKNLTVEGGYDSACTSTGGGVTRLEGSTSTGSTVDVTSGSTVTLRNLELTWGDDVGAGLDVRDSSIVTLDNVDIYYNHGNYGGGIYIITDSQVNTINGNTASTASEIHHNTASIYGGGARVWGQFNGSGNYSDITYNCAPHGGGFDVPGGILNLNASDTYHNRAAQSTGQGGGIRVINNGDVTLSNGAYVYFRNEAYNGAGVYASNSTVNLEGAGTTFRYNVASNDGGALYLTNGSTLNSSGSRVGQPGTPEANQAIRGAGIFAEDSTINFSGQIVNNTAQTYGGGIYADNCTLNLNSTEVGGTDAYDPNRLTSSVAMGAGLFLTNTVAVLNDTTISSNEIQGTGLVVGTGAFLVASDVTLTNSTIELNAAAPATIGLGGGLTSNGSTITLDNSQAISNTAQQSGGGIWLFNGSTLNVLNDSSIADNESLLDSGGGIGATQASNINIQNSILQDNSSAVDGGAIWIKDSNLQATNAVMRDNEAAVNGGAIAAESSHVIVGANYTECDPLAGQCSSLYNNTADSDANDTGHGGAIYANESILQVDYSYFHRNSGRYGGAIYQDGASATAQINNTLIYSNTTTYGIGAGIRADDGTFSMMHVTLADNVNGAAYSQPSSGVVNSIAHNSIAWGNVIGFYRTFDDYSCNIDQENNIGLNQDPRFVNPGVGEDYHLQSGSPAVDACSTGLPYDLDNVMRPRLSDYDMGAFEVLRAKIYLPLVLKN